LPIGIRLAVALVTIGLASSCASAHKRFLREAPEWQRALVLSATVPPVVESARPATVTFRVQNQGARKIDGCIGSARSVSSNGIGVIRLVDHPYCLKQFSLVPQAHVEWTEELSLPDVAPGRVFLSIEVQIVHPRACERKFGCYATDISTGAYTEARTATSPRRFVFPQISN